MNSELKALNAKQEGKTNTNAVKQTDGNASPFRNSNARGKNDDLSPQERVWLRGGAFDMASFDIVDPSSSVDRAWAREQTRKSMAANFTVRQADARGQPTLAFHSVLGLKARKGIDTDSLDAQDDWMHRNRRRLEVKVSG